MSTPSEQVIRRLYQITQQYSAGLHAQVSALLSMGLERLELDIGILSHIDGTSYRVVRSVTPPDITLSDNTRFDLADTPCKITCEANDPVAFEDMSTDEAMRTHPAYTQMGLCSYIGIPIKPEGVLYGTLNFSSPQARQRQFSEVDVDALRLMASWIEVELIRRRQEEQLRQANQELQHIAEHDSLTKAVNRRGMYHSFRQRLESLERRRGSASLVMIDIDHFKCINDQFGHQTGDEVLSAVAETIACSMRKNDVLCRFGGEEFLLWLDDTEHQTCEAVCERIRTSVASLSLLPSPVTISLGACHFCCADGKPQGDTRTLKKLIKQADSALYQAKWAGRNRFHASNEVVVIH